VLLQAKAAKAQAEQLEREVSGLYRDKVNIFERAIVSPVHFQWRIGALASTQRLLFFVPLNCFKYSLLKLKAHR
jgi:hypothetical protein